MSRQKTRFQRPRPADTVRVRLRIARQRIVFTDHKRRGPPGTRRGYAYYGTRKCNVYLLPTGFVKVQLYGRHYVMPPNQLALLPAR